METSVAIPLGVHVAVRELRRRASRGDDDASVAEEDPAYTSNTLLRPAFVEWLMGLPEGWTDMNRRDAKDFVPHDGWKEWLNPPAEGCAWEQPGATVEVDAPRQRERCGALGNAVVPLAAWEAFRTLAGLSPRERRVAPPRPPIRRRLNPNVTVEVPFPDPDLAEALRGGTSLPGDPATNEPEPEQPEPEPEPGSKRKFASNAGDGDEIRPETSGDGATHTQGRWKHVSPRQTASATVIPSAPVLAMGYRTPLQYFRDVAGVTDGAAELVRRFARARRDVEVEHARAMLRVQDVHLRENMSMAFGSGWETVDDEAGVTRYGAIDATREDEQR